MTHNPHFTRKLIVKGIVADGAPDGALTLAPVVISVPEFEPHVKLCADSSEPRAYFEICVSLSLSLSLRPSPTHALSLSQN